MNKIQTIPHVIDHMLSIPAYPVSLFQYNIFYYSRFQEKSNPFDNLSCPYPFPPDRGFDANDYYRYFLKHGERFVIRAKKNRNVIYNGETCNITDVALRYKGAYRNLNLFATLAVGYISLTMAVHENSIFLAELKECSKRTYKMPKFIFYAIGYALESVLSMCRTGIRGFLPPKVRSQQITLFEHYKIADCET